MIGAEVLPWLLESENPSARTLALTELLDLPPTDPDVVAARAAIPGWGPARAILDAQWPAGYWMRPGAGYSPKYKATVWQVIFLAALGAPRTEAIDRACGQVLDLSRLPDGRFSTRKTATGAIACLNGNLLRALFQLGYEDARLENSVQSLAGMVARDGFRCRYNATRPFPTRMAGGQPCAWGAIKALGAFAQVPEGQRSPSVRAAIDSGVAFLLATALASGDFPTATAPSPLWRRFGFPLGYTSDLVEALDVLRRLGVTEHPRLAPAIDIVLSKQDEGGRWTLEHTPDNTWAGFGTVGRPNKWVTLRALSAVQHKLNECSSKGQVRGTLEVTL